MASANIPSTMKACQVVEYNKPYKIQDVKVPRDLRPNDLLVKVAVASLCHTDGMVVAGIFNSKLPITASHEGAGTVVAMGSNVKDWKVGDRCMVALQSNYCGKCSTCKGPEDRRHYCPYAGWTPGITGDGAFAEYMIADAMASNKIPDKVTFETAAPLACAGRTVYRGVEQTRLQPGQWVGIVGAGGGLGHLGIQFAKAKGLKVVAIDARDEGLSLSKEYGADVILDARKGKEEVVKQAQESTNGEGCDATIVLSDADSAAGLAAAVTRMHGRMIQIAQPDEVKIPFAELIFRDIKIEGSLVASIKQGEEMLDLVSKHGITVRTNALKGIDKVPELVELSHSGKMQGKGIIIVDDAAIEKEKELGAKF